MNYCDIEFKKKFLEIEFDDILNEQNNKYVNSDEYLQYKDVYLTSFNKRLEELIKLKIEYDILNNFYTKTYNNKYIYNVIDVQSKEKHNNLIKILIQEQKKDLENFLHYIDFLNGIFK